MKIADNVWSMPNWESVPHWDLNEILLKIMSEEGCIPKLFVTSPATWQRIATHTDRSMLFPPEELGKGRIALVFGMYGIKVKITADPARKDGVIALLE